MKKLSNTRLRKIQSIKKRVEKIQFDLYTFGNVNADYVAFEFDAIISLLEKSDTWYEKKH
jgi:hypothetical protein